MAGFGVSYPVFAPFLAAETDTAMPAYDTTKKVVLGHLVSANETVTLATGELWGDNKRVLEASEFASAAVPMETDDISDESASVVYGATVVDQRVEYKAADNPPYGGLGFVRCNQLSGDEKKYYQGWFYPKAKAALGNNNNQTRGSSITYQTITTNFNISAPLYDAGAWKITETFDTEAAARDWVDSMFEPAGGSGG